MSEDFVSKFLRACEALDTYPESECVKRIQAMREMQFQRLPLPAERDAAALDAFFTADVLAERVLICPEINRDMTDDADVFGYEVGFVYIVGVWPTWEKPTTIAERAWLQGQKVSWRTGLPCGVITSFDWFPRHMLEMKPITPERDGELFSYLLRRIRQPAMGFACKQLS